LGVVEWPVGQGLEISINVDSYGRFVARMACSETMLKVLAEAAARMHAVDPSSATAIVRTFRALHQHQ
jgi:hypothetical protein